MPDQIELPHPQPHPLLVLKAAVRWATAAGHRVRLGTPWGVHCVSSHARDRWEVDPRVGALDPIGCAILAAQPEATDPWCAAAEALSAPLAWLHGLAEAMDGEPASKSWSEGHARALYASGREAGTLYRADFHRKPPELIQ